MSQVFSTPNANSAQPHTVQEGLLHRGMGWRSNKSWQVITTPYWGMKNKQNTTQSLSTSYERLHYGTIAVVCMMAFAFMGLVDRTLFSTPPSPHTTTHKNGAEFPLAERATIFDRNGLIMARSLPSDNLMAYPRGMIDIYDAVDKIISVLPNKNAEKLLARLERGKPFLIQRDITPREKQAINALGIPGLEFEKTEVRVYPQERIASHILGGVHANHTGRMGLEKSLQNRLTQYDRPVHLSIDARVQSVVHDELSTTMKKYKATSASALVMNPKTGEIVSMVSLPDFDLDRIRTDEAKNMFNHATQGAYEMGSTFKIINTALALERGTHTLADTVDVETPMKIGQFEINDTHKQRGRMTPADIFIYSSNIGTARMALQVGTEQQQKFLGELGLLNPTPLELGEVATPIIPKNWSKTTTATVSFGHGISVSPLSILNATNAVLNGGILRQPTLLSLNELPQGKRVVSQKTSRAIRHLMRLNVTKGTGANADVPGYLVGGKTGTADIWTADLGYASQDLMVSFLGAYPIHNPQYTVLVTVERPQVHTGRPSGGRVAAPAVGNIIRRTAPLLGVKPVGNVQRQITDRMMQTINYRANNRISQDWD